MMKLIAKATVITGQGRFVPGDKFEVQETEAEELIASGYAVEDTSPPEPSADKPGKKQSGSGNV